MAKLQIYDKTQPSSIQAATNNKYDKTVTALMAASEAKKNGASTEPLNTESSNVGSYYDQQKSLLSDQYAAQEAKRIAALRAQKKKTLAALETAKGATEETYLSNRAEAVGSSELGAKNLAEYLSQRGQTQSGIAAAGEMQRTANLQGTVGSLQQQRANTLANIAAQEAAAQAEYESGVTSARAETTTAEDQALQNLLAQQRQESISTIGAESADYQSAINRINSEIQQGNYSNAYLLPYYKQARAEKQASIASAQAEAEQQAFENQLALYKAQKTGSSGGGGASNKPTITAAQALTAYNNGIRTDQVLSALGYYYGMEFSQPEQASAPQLLNQNAYAAKVYNALLQGQITKEQADYLNLQSTNKALGI